METCIVCNGPVTAYRRTTCSPRCTRHAKAHAQDTQRARIARMPAEDQAVARMVAALDAPFAAGVDEDTLRRYEAALRARRMCETAAIQATWSERERRIRAGAGDKLPMTAAEIGSGVRFNGRTLERSE